MSQTAAGGSAWLVLPTYNEAGNVENVVAEALAHLPTAARVLIVDDASPDGTGAIADRLAADLPDRVEVLHRAGKEGLGPAYIAGFHRALAAGASLVLEMDADFSHDPADLPRLLAAVEAGADLAIGSRYVAGGGIEAWSPGRRLLSRGGSAYARTILGLGVRDLTGGFRCFRREVLEAIDLTTVDSKGYAFQVEIAYRAVRGGFHVVEVPIVFRDRRDGVSKMTAGIAAEAVLRIPWMRLRVGFGSGGRGDPARCTSSGATDSADALERVGPPHADTRSGSPRPPL